MHGTLSNHVLRTFTGKLVDLLDPKPGDIDLCDIAHSLSLLNRFNGHTLRPYSVATHSLHVSSLVPKGLELHGLLHDAAEAYLGDVVRPLKRGLPGYALIEEKLESAIWQYFGLTWNPERCIAVKRADNLALRTEWTNFFVDYSPKSDPKADPTGTFADDSAAAEAGGLPPCVYCDRRHWKGPQSALRAEDLFLLRCTTLMLGGPS
jgi:hypothetical protein